MAKIVSVTSMSRTLSATRTTSRPMLHLSRSTARGSWFVTERVKCTAARSKAVATWSSSIIEGHEG